MQLQVNSLKADEGDSLALRIMMHITTVRHILPHQRAKIF